MKTTVIRKDLAKALNVASRFISPKAQLPILGNVMLKTDKTHLSILATNLEMSIAIKIGAKVEIDGDITIPARSLTDLINNLIDETVTLTAKEESLHLASADFNAQLGGMNSSEFPIIPETIKKGIEINKEELVGGLTKTLFSVSLDETRPSLTGVLFKNDIGGHQYLIASDGFRLSQVKLGGIKTAITNDVIIPKTILSEIVRIAEDGVNINFSHDSENNQVLFGIGNMILSSRVIEGQFPDVQNIIPKSTRVKIEVGKDELLRAVKLASVIARGSGSVVKIQVLKAGLEVAAENAQTGSQKTTLDAKVDGEAGVTISFNYRFIEEFLNAIKGNTVELGFNDTTSPGLLLDVDDSDYLHLIMPVRS